jgi:Tetratricopeptide repeat
MDHPDVAISLNDLASLLQDKGDLAEAELLIRRGLEIRENKLGLEHPDVAISLNNLVYCLVNSMFLNKIMLYYM